MKISIPHFSILSAALLFSLTAFAGGSLQCLDHGKPISVDDQQVIKWKHTTANQFLARAHVQGKIGQIFSDKNGHKHFELQMDNHTDDTVEIVYSLAFGVLPTLKSGMNVEACGDYITSTGQTGSFPPSPDGAILHWVHKNPKDHGHDSGFVAIDGVTYGQK